MRVLMIWILAAGMTTAQLAVENVRGTQRAGTKLVDIYYDITGTEDDVSVTLEVSSDGGSTWSVPAKTLREGANGRVSPGRNRRLIWDAGVDWDGQFSGQIRYRVRATHDVPVPDGFVLIPAGSFQIGDGFGDGKTEELPVHSVFVNEFYMAKHEATKRLWDEVRSWGRGNGYSDLPVGGGKAANHPVHTISWYAIAKWCNARSEKESLSPCYLVGGEVYRTGVSDDVICNWSATGYRLPSEAEWEKAARGGLIGERFPWGRTITHSQANYSASGRESYDLSAGGYHPTYRDWATPYTSPVGSFAPNDYGLYDMPGNVGEWCWDWFDVGYYESSPGAAPHGPATGFDRVLRGGGWEGYARYTRCAARYKFEPGFANYDVGFRLARGL